MLTRLLATFGALLLVVAAARADTALPPPNGYSHFVVPSCGGATYSAGTWRPPTIDLTGIQCTTGGSGGGGGGSGGQVWGYDAEGAAITKAPLYNGFKDAVGNARGVSPTYQLPVNTYDVRGSSTLDTSSTASKVDLSLNGTATAGLTFGTFPAGAVVTFYTSNDGGATYTVKASTNCSAPQNASSTYSTSNGQPRIDVAGATNLRVVVSSTAAGTLPYSYNLSSAPLACPNIQGTNTLQWAGTLVGAPTTYGTAPTGAAPGVNAYVTNFPATQAVSWSGQTVAATQSGAWSVAINNFPTTQTVAGTVTANQGTPASTANAWPTTDTNASQTITVAGTAAAKAQGVQGAGAGALPVGVASGVTGTLSQPVDVPCGVNTVCTLSNQTSRKYLAITSTAASGYCRVAYSGVTPTATRGDPLAPANAANSQGGGRTFDGVYVPQGTVSAICTTASTIAVMEIN